MEFKKYQHVERFGNTEVNEIELGECFVFPKIDGTNASVWLSDDGKLCAGSRNRELSLEKDNAGFYDYVIHNKEILDLLQEFPQFRLYGEWLVPHSLKTYREDSWRNFYVFDVTIDNEDGSVRYVHYDEYAPILEAFNIKYIPPICKIKNGSYEQFINQLNNNIFLIKDGSGVGEGIVIKRYNFTNRYGRTTWAKIVTSEFKEKHSKVMGCSEIKGKKMIEEEIVDVFLTKAMIEKIHAKISLDEWSSKKIPQLLSTCYYDLIKEESWSFIKKYKNPIINYGTLQHFVFSKVKKEMSNLF